MVKDRARYTRIQPGGVGVPAECETTPHTHPDNREGK